MFFISWLIVALGQPSFFPWLGPISAALGYALFWRSLPENGRFWRSMLWYMLVSLIQLSWMCSIEYQGVYILLVWLALSAGVGAQFGLLTLLIPRDRSLHLTQILAIASFWTIMEWSRFFFLCGYSWNLSGLALSHPYAIQCASIFGVLGLSFWVIFSNLLFFRLKNRPSQFISWAAAVCLPYIFGFAHFHFHERQMEKSKQQLYSCLLVQTGLLPSEKMMLDQRPLDYLSPYHQWSRILHLLKESRPADLIVLPEAAVPYPAHRRVYSKEIVDNLFVDIFGPGAAGSFPEVESEKVSNAYWMQALSNFFNCEVIAGLDHEAEGGKSFSSAFHAKPRINFLSRYDKRVLVPMVEYLPFSFLAPLAAGYGITGFFEHGAEAKIFNGKIPLAVSICYEETFPQNVREGRLKGAKMLINVTNDGWYPNSRLPSQHFEHARLRTVENGAPLLRACNTGISAAVDSLGRTVGKLAESSDEKTLQAGVLFAEISPYEYQTLFLVWGNGGILSLSALFIAVFLKIRSKKEFAVAKIC